MSGDTVWELHVKLKERTEIRVKNEELSEQLQSFLHISRRSPPYFYYSEVDRNVTR